MLHSPQVKIACVFVEDQKSKKNVNGSLSGFIQLQVRKDNAIRFLVKFVTKNVSRVIIC